MGKKPLLIKCPECKHKHKADVAICSVCGFDIASNVKKLKAEAQQRYEKRFKKTGILRNFINFFKK